MNNRLKENIEGMREAWNQLYSNVSECKTKQDHKDYLEYLGDLESEVRNEIIVIRTDIENFDQD